MIDYTPDMTDSQLFEAATLMRKQGGGFASCIAEAFLRADSSNKKRLLSAFGDLFAKYLAYVEAAKERTE